MAQQCATSRPTNLVVFRTYSIKCFPSLLHIYIYIHNTYKNIYIYRYTSMICCNDTHITIHHKHLVERLVKVPSASGGHPSWKGTRQATRGATQRDRWISLSRQCGSCSWGSDRGFSTWIIYSTMWGPLLRYKLVYDTPSNYGYNYHKPKREIVVMFTNLAIDWGPHIVPLLFKHIIIYQI